MLLFNQIPNVIVIVARFGKPVVRQTTGNPCPEECQQRQDEQTEMVVEPLEGSRFRQHLQHLGQQEDHEENRHHDGDPALRQVPGEEDFGGINIEYHRVNQQCRCQHPIQQNSPETADLNGFGTVLHGEKEHGSQSAKQQQRRLFVPAVPDFARDVEKRLDRISDGGIQQIEDSRDEQRPHHRPGHLHVALHKGFVFGEPMPHAQPQR